MRTLSAALFLSSLTLLVGCSHGGSGGSGLNLSTASPTPIAKIEIVKTSGDVSREFQTLQGCSKNYNGTPTSYLHVGSAITKRNDTLYTDGYGRKHNEVDQATETVEKIIDANNFITTTIDQLAQYSITARVHNTLYPNSSNSDVLSVISTNPPSLLKRMESQKPYEETSYSSCNSVSADDNSFTSTLQSATATLRDGRVIHGVLQKTVEGLKNYSCKQIRDADKKVLSQTTVAPYAQQVNVVFYSAELTNPFATCDQRHQLLTTQYVQEAQMDSTGKIMPTGRMLAIDKQEVLAVH